MNIKEYISSGIIEAYVMGLATPEEASILECVQKNSEEVRNAVLEAERMMLHLAQEQAVAPPVSFKEAIWDKLSKEVASVESVTEHNIPKFEVTTSELKNKNQYKSLAIAASLLLVGSLFTNIFLQQKRIEQNDKLNALLQEKNKTQNDFSTLEAKWAMMSKPGVRPIVLQGVEKHPDAKAMVYWDKASNEVYLSIENLPTTSAEQQYQLWAIVDGKPVSAGVFDADSGQVVQKLATIAKAQAFAITLEKKGGSATPTLENMYVMGASS